MLKINNVEKYYYLGDCVSGLDDPSFQDRVADDATVLAQLVEEGTPLTIEEFLNIAFLPQSLSSAIQINPNNYAFFANNRINIIWAYDDTKDVHYFFGK